MEEIRKVKTVCRSCHGGCGVLAHVKGDKVVKVEADPEAPIGMGTLCSKGLAITQLAYHPDRIKYPQKKTARGWERIGWDEALDTVAHKFKEVIREHGPEAIIVGQGTGRDFESHFSRFGNLLGTPNILTAGHMCYLSRIGATLTTCGRHPAIDYANNPKCIVMWACNPQWTNPDEYKGANFWKAYQNGTELIVIDPRKGFLAQKADLWLQLRPGTDAALALGFFRVIVDEELFDKEFVENHIHGWEAFLKRAGRVFPGPGGGDNLGRSFLDPKSGPGCTPTTKTGRDTLGSSHRAEHQLYRLYPDRAVGLMAVTRQSGRPRRQCFSSASAGPESRRIFGSPVPDPRTAK